MLHQESPGVIGFPANQCPDLRAHAGSASQNPDKLDRSVYGFVLKICTYEWDGPGTGTPHHAFPLRPAVLAAGRSSAAVPAKAWATCSGLLQSLDGVAPDDVLSGFANQVHRAGV